MNATHVGFRRETGYIHSASRGLYGHKDNSGKVHALTGSNNIYSGAIYTALCGKAVQADHDGHGFNIAPIGAEGWRVTCRRCRKLSS